VGDAVRLARRTRILESLQIWPARSELNDIAGTRRGLILAPLLAALPAELLTDSAHAVDPTQTQITLPDQMEDLWVVRKGATPAFPGQRGFVGLAA
jgi:RNA-splicing ligase RtcB